MPEMIGNNINRIIIRWEAFKLGGDVATETDNSKMRALMSLGMHELLLMGGFEHSRSAASVILPLPRVGWVWSPIISSSIISSYIISSSKGGVWSPIISSQLGKHPDIFNGQV